MEVQTTIWAQTEWLKAPIITKIQQRKPFKTKTMELWEAAHLVTSQCSALGKITTQMEMAFKGRMVQTITFNLIR